MSARKEESVLYYPSLKEARAVVETPERIILSPGPGRPEDAGIIIEA